jgi:hypothetical protein
MKKVTMVSLFSGLFVMALCLVMPLTAYSVDKLIVQNAGNVDVFKVNDAGDITTSGILGVQKEWALPASTNIISTFTSYGDMNRMVMRQAGGTSLAPLATGSGQNIGAFAFRGYDATNGFPTASDAALNVVGDEAFTSTAHGTRFVFYGTNLGTKGATEWLRLTNGR